MSTKKTDKPKLTPIQQEAKELRRQIERRLKDIEKRGYIATEKLKTNLSKPAARTKLREMKENIYKYVKYYDPLKDMYISGAERRKQEKAIAARKGWETRRRKAAEEYYRSHRSPEEFQDLVWARRKERGEQGETSEYDELPREAEKIMNEVLDMIDTWKPSPEWSSQLAEIKQEDRNKLSNIVHGAINEYGFDQCVRNIKDQATWFKSICQEILRGSGNKFRMTGREEVRNMLNEVATIIRGRPLTVREAMDIDEQNIDMNEGE